MATYKVRGNSHTVIYPFRLESGEKKQQWETYESELEAIQRKTYIDYLQKKKYYAEIRRSALEYRQKSAITKSVKEQLTIKSEPDPPTVPKEDNRKKTFREFMEKFLPYHVRKERLSPNTYDSYRSNLNNHIYPVFGDRIMSSITAEDIDNFIDAMSKKPCKGPKGHAKNGDIPLLSSSSIKKCFNVLTSGFSTAKAWHYIDKIPEVTPPAERTTKRKAWTPAQVYSVLQTITNDPLLHLAVHIGFVCSLRAGEVVGIDIDTINLDDSSLWITREIERVSDAAIEATPKNELIQIFPKQVAGSKSSLILKSPKTEASHRKQYLPKPLVQEIRERLNRIELHKSYFGNEYRDYGLLICHPDGRPIEPKTLDKLFKEHQRSISIPKNEQIEFQGLRKSGQMHKVRLTQNNYQLVAENAGQSPEVLMSNYNEALDSEKRTLAMLVENSFYPGQAANHAVEQTSSIIQAIKQNPELLRSILENLLPTLGGAYTQNTGSTT